VSPGAQFERGERLRRGILLPRSCSMRASLKSLVKYGSEGRIVAPFVRPRISLDRDTNQKPS
jgi:hypothetical protein